MRQAWCNFSFWPIASLRCDDGFRCYRRVAEVEPQHEKTPRARVPSDDHLRHLAFRCIECAGFWRPKVLQHGNGRPDVLPSHPQAPRQHRISRVRQVANSGPRLLVFNVDREQRHRAREAPDQCRDL